MVSLRAMQPIFTRYAPQINPRLLRLSAIAALSITVILFLWSFSEPGDFPSPRKFAGSITTQFTSTSKTIKDEVSSHGYSIKPIAYIFPQYYPFEQNNRLWGPNFTEWDNVNKVTKNGFGLETVRPTEEIGYYNGLEFATRERQGRLIRENGFYGLAYHHYWMAGTPIMDHILQAMLLDGEPNTHFMLSWANEPWTATWDGLDSSKVLIAQDYGDITDWRKHFDWLLPFFRHPNYIRSEGKVQFIIYYPAHIDKIAPGAKYAMYAAWRKWAAEEGLVGMDIIETRHPANPPFSASDAVNEFQPHASGMNPEFHHLTDRVSKVYHRGSMVCWDSTPRHATDGRAKAWPTCHPKSWESLLVRLMARIKQDPNPRGIENFLFVNALNEWGEGNVLEPSVQFGSQYAEAMKNAVRIAEEKYVWQSQDMSEGLKRIQAFNSMINKTIKPPEPDVCLIIRAGPENGFGQQFPLDDMIFSLQAQTNANWRAVVFNTNGKSLKIDILRRMEPRIEEFVLPAPMDKGNATDLLLANITNTYPVCASAKYMLISDGGNIYHPTAFELAESGTADFVGMNVESKYTIRDEKILAGELCLRLSDPSRNLHAPSIPTATGFSLPATFISLPKYLSTLRTGLIYPPYLPLTFISYPAIIPNTTSPNPSTLDSSPISLSPAPSQEAGLLVETLVHSHEWTFARQGEDGGDEVRHVLANPSYTGCNEMGHIWVDSLVFGETGCYNTPDLGALYGGWKGVDLEFYRRHGSCTRKLQS